MLYLDTGLGDILDIGDGTIRIEVSQRKGQRVKIGIDAPKNMPVKLVNKSAGIRQQGLPDRKNFNDRKK